MNRSFLYKNFRNWLKENRSRFKVEPYITDVTKDSFRVHFRGIRGICLVVNRGSEFSIWSFCKDSIIFESYKNYYGEIVVNQKSRDEFNSLSDWVADFDLVCHRDTAGKYFCDLCDEGQPQFGTREELYRVHSYEPFLVWVNTILANADCIVFYVNYTLVGIKEEILKRNNTCAQRKLLDEIVEIDGTKSISRSINDKPFYIFDITQRL